MKICLDIATGLTHLHLETQGTQGKPAIAHRDLKLDNIFCTSRDPLHTKLIIGDLGIAVRVEPGKKTTGYTGTPGTC